MYPAMTMEEIQRTTLADLEVMRRAYEMRRVDDLFLASFTAWQGAAARGTDRKGKPIYKSFKDFFNYEKEMKKVAQPRRRKRMRVDAKGLSLAAKANREV